MIEQVNKKILNLLEIPYNISLLILTGLFYIILANPYNANANFDMLTAVISYKIYFCGAAFLLLLNNNQAIEARREAALINLSAMISAIIALMFCKSLVIPRMAAELLIIITIFMFLFSIKKLYLLIK